MIKIEKHAEPHALTQYRLTPYSYYDNMGPGVKSAVLDSLMAEQGYLCAYCMCRIGGEKHKATIEHRKPQSICTETEKLDYRNMLAVCWGNRDATRNEDKSCDAKRGALPIDNQAMKRIDVLNEDTLKGIQYFSDGTIYSPDPDTDEDLNLRLNLNCEKRGLKECRRKALQELQRDISRRYPDKTAKKQAFQRYLTYYTRQGQKKTPYCGIIIAWLQSKVG